MPSVGKLLATGEKKVDRIQAMQMFVRVAEAGSFVRAAETLSCQPCILKIIKKIGMIWRLMQLELSQGLKSRCGANCA
jgi:hypothetical protein